MREGTGASKVLKSISTLPIRNITEARVWVKKYLIADSLSNFPLTISIKGMNAKVFSSNPTQEINSEGAEATKMILPTIEERNKRDEGVKNIGEKDSPIDGVWTH